MARTTRPDSIYRVSVHRNAGHSYAATHPYTVDDSGKRRYRILHWGTVTDDLRFIPGKRYIEASEELRRRLIFPQGWDLSATRALSVTETGKQRHPLQFHPGDGGKAFGDVWLLEQVVGRYGLRDDLAEALGDASMADDLLTLSYFPFLTGMSFLRFQRWQSESWTPSHRTLEAMLEESLGSVSRTSFRRLMDLRRERFKGGRMCAVDSVTRQSSGPFVSDRKWGQKTERIHFQSTIEAVAYSLDEHVPVVYTTFPEAVTDVRGIDIFRSELAKYGLPGITMVTDRGYDSLQGMEQYYKEGPMVMCVDVKQSEVMERIEAFGRFRQHPAGMRYDEASRRYYRQYPLSGSPDVLRLNLFFNPERRTAELSQIDEVILSQQSGLQEMLDYGITLDDRRSLKRDFYFFNCTYDAASRCVTSFSPNRSRILSTRAASGFYANVTSGLDIDPLQAVSIYSLKYDQERFLRHFRSLLEFPQSRMQPEKMYYGLQILQYTGLLLNTWLRHAVQTAPSAGASLPGITGLLDSLHDIPCTDAGDGTCRPPSQEVLGF